MKKFSTFIKEFRVNQPDPADTLGIPRNKMPQIRSKDMDEFFRYLKDNGARFKEHDIPAGQLKPIQSEFNDVKVVQGIQRQLSGEGKKPVLVSSDNYVIDGNHRWLSMLNKGPDENVKTIQVTNMPVRKLLQLTLDFDKVEFQDIKESLQEKQTLAEKLTFKKMKSGEWLGNGFGSTGATYVAIKDGEKTNVTLEPAAGSWVVYQDGKKIRRWDNFKFAKEHAAELLGVES